MPPPEDSRQPNDNQQTLRLRSSSDDEGFGLDQTIDSQLYATIKNGTADVSQLKVLIPGFEILEELGRGAFGVVYRARDVKLDRHVAIKVSLLDDPDRREQYIREARNAAKLEAVGIVPVFQVGTLRDGQPFVVQRLIDGNSLRKMLSEAGAIDLRRACQLMVDIAEAVAHAHAVGMIHRDLKPDNILVDPAGRPWVADFGLAILEEDQKQHRGERAGTPLYMSPEQLRGRTEWLDGRTDIYALGIMLYEMLTGRPPFDAYSLAELEEQVLHRDPKPITQRTPHLPVAMDIIFQNCCAKQVSDRYANAHELVADLQAVLAELTQSDTQLPPSRGVGLSDGGLRPFSPLPVPVRRKTLVQSQPLSTTLLQQSSLRSLGRYTIPAAIGGVALLGLALILLWPSGRDPNELKPADNASSVAGTLLTDETPVVELPNVDSTLDPVDRPVNEIPQTPPSTVPQRPFRVSKGSGGTHTTIRAAIAMAEAGETITVLPGTYVETLLLDRNLNLVGQGNRDDIVIVGENRTAISMSGDIAVTLDNLTLDGNKSSDLDLNTVDVHGGALTLSNCNVYSRSFDCVNLRPSSGLTANNCRFRTTAHPAVSADRTRHLLLTGCNFDIRPPTLDTTSIPVGVQATDSPGHLRDCTFVGSGAAIGIHWEDTLDLVSIENVTIGNCQSGMIIQRCAQVQIAANQRTSLTGCQSGLLLEDSTAQISKIDIHGNGGKQGIRIIDTRPVPASPSVTIDDCQISGYGDSLAIQRANVKAVAVQSSNSQKTGIMLGVGARLELSNSVVSQSENNGILIEDSQAQLTDCQLLDNAGAGILIDGQADALSAVNCTFQDNTSGLVVASGTVKLREVEFSTNGLGILVVTRELLGQTSASETLPIFLEIERVQFINNQHGGITIHAPCSYRILEDANDRGKEQSTPKIVGELKAAQVGDVTVVKPIARGGKKLN